MVKEIDDVIADLADIPAPSLDVRKFVAAGLKEFGGPEGLAKTMHHLLKSPGMQPGVRARVLSDFTRLWLHCTIAEEEEDRSVEDMQAEAQEILDVQRTRGDGSTDREPAPSSSPS